MIDSDCAIRVLIVSLRQEHEVSSKLRVSEQCSDALYNIAKVEVEREARNIKHLALEGGTRGGKGINYHIELSRVLV